MFAVSSLPKETRPDDECVMNTENSTPRLHIFHSLDTHWCVMEIVSPVLFNSALHTSK